MSQVLNLKLLAAAYGALVPLEHAIDGQAMDGELERAASALREAIAEVETPTGLPVEMVKGREHHPHEFTEPYVGDWLKKGGTQFCCHCGARRDFTVRRVDTDPAVCSLTTSRYEFASFGEWDHECKREQGK